VDTLSYKTISANKATANKEWVIVDAEGQVLGRLGSKVAKILRGKNKPSFTPHADCGDNVIVINAEKVVLTGKKMSDKVYIRHTGYPGGQRQQTATELMAKFPERLVEKAVKGMLPKNKLGRKLYNNLHVVIGAEHKYEAQKPKVVDLNTIK
jgi:large subunit ribosomal protein L13